jgi:hypothetical protein
MRRKNLSAFSGQKHPFSGQKHPFSGHFQVKNTQKHRFSYQKHLFSHQKTPHIRKNGPVVALQNIAHDSRGAPLIAVLGGLIGDFGGF